MPTHSTEPFPVTLTPEVLSTLPAAVDRVVVDCRFSLQDPALGYQQYCQGHIPGAYYLDLNQDLASPGAWRASPAPGYSYPRHKTHTYGRYGTNPRRGLR
jgi:3-mercaptopyruvate sulfurtransferase SseA